MLTPRAPEPAGRRGEGGRGPKTTSGSYKIGVSKTRGKGKGADRALGVHLAALALAGRHHNVDRVRLVRLVLGLRVEGVGFRV